MKENCKITVLVAAYNAGKYIRKCLDSLVNQTLREIQVICIDDASTDDTLSVLNEYAAADSRFTVLAQSVNQGQAVARNRGLEKAEGEFVTFLDSDDWFAGDALEKAYQVVIDYPGTDTVLMNLYYYYEDKDSSIPYPNRAGKKVFSGKEALVLSLDWSIHGVYMVRNTIHQAYPYDTSSRMYSDDNTTHLHFLHSREVRFCEGIYYYRQHPTSGTSACTVRRFDYMDAGLNLKKLLLEEGLGRDVLSRHEGFRWANIVGLYVYFLRNRSVFTPKEQQKIIRRFRFHHSRIESALLASSLKYRFGYIPFKNSFDLFRLEVRAYHFLRILFRRGNR